MAIHNSPQFRRRYLCPLKLKGREGRSIYQCFANGTKRILQASLALRLDWYSQELLRTVFTRTISWEEEQ